MKTFLICFIFDDHLRSAKYEIRYISEHKHLWTERPTIIVGTQIQNRYSSLIKPPQPHNMKGLKSWLQLHVIQSTADHSPDAGLRGPNYAQLIT